MNSKEIKADIAALERAAEHCENQRNTEDAKRLRRMAREIRENVLLIATKKRATPPITDFERKLIDQR